MNHFKFIESRIVESIQSEVQTYAHPSGATLVWFKNKDQHKTFGIGFKTVPKTSNGVAHILEHCVLNGSRKYKSKEPFMELVKSSLNTFINAMTYPDMTLYPISTLDHQDYFNLMNVYLDAVFFPKCVSKEEIFRQEGWHYVLENKEDDLQISGVVYNEMKGAYGNVDRIVMNQVMSTFYGKTHYGIDSGGDPKEIYSLSYEEFVEFHHTYYHPSNSLIYLYGDVEIERILECIDKEYLSYFKDPHPPVILDEHHFYSGKNEVEYTYASDQEEKGILTLTFALDNKVDAYQTFFLNLLSNILFNSESSIVKRELLNHGLGDEVFSIGPDMLNSPFGVGVKNVDVSLKDKFVDVVYKSLEKVVSEGLSERLVKGMINQYELSVRDFGGKMKGLLFFINAMNSFKYGKDLCSNIDVAPYFTQIKNAVENKEFELFIKEHLLNNAAVLVGIHHPSTSLQEENDIALKNHLKDVKAQMSEIEVEKIISDYQKLKEFQNREDTLEDKQTIPRLKLSDIDARPNVFETIRKQHSGVTYLIHPAKSQGIQYLNFSFDCTFESMEEVNFVGLYCLLAGSMNTKHHAYTDLSENLLLHGGGVSVSANSYGHISKDKTTSTISFSTYSVMEELPHAIEDVFEIMLETDFSDFNRMKEIILEKIVSYESYLESSGHVFVMNRVKSMNSLAGQIFDGFKGLSFYDFLRGWVNRLDETIVSKLEAVKQNFIKSKTIVSITGDDFENVYQIVLPFIEKLSEDSTQKIPFSFTPNPVKEAIIIPSRVNYVSVGDNFNPQYSFDGSYHVLSNILSTQYLYSEIRAKNGAYGAGIAITPIGSVNTYSYRDPKILETIETYRNCAQWLSQLELDQSEVESYVIGTLGMFLDPKSAAEINTFLLNRELTGLTQEKINESFDQAKNTNLDKLKSFGNMIKDMTNTEALSVLGNETDILKHKELFGCIRPLKKDFS